MTSFTNMLYGTLYFALCVVFIRFFIFGIMDFATNLFPNSAYNLIFTILQYVFSLMLLILVPMMFFRGDAIVDKLLNKV